jgi:kinetochore protein Spc7/SPC105
VDALEKEHGWAVTGVAGTQVSMTYKREIELVFDMASFQPNQPNSRIDLWYIAANRERSPEPSTVEKEFFLQGIRDHVRGLPQSRTKVRDLLHMVRAAWDRADHTTNDIRLLNVTFPTKVTKTSDSSVAVSSTLLLVPIQTKVEVLLGLTSTSTPGGVVVSIAPQASVVYGEHFNVDKIAEYLSTRIGTEAGAEMEESWSNVVVELHERLLARGRKAAS